MSGSLAQILLAAALVPAARPSVLVAVEPGIEAYATALQGLTSVLGPTTVRVVELRPGGGDLGLAMSARDVQVVVAVGGRALAEVHARRVPVPVVATMVLKDNADPDCSRVELEVPLLQQLDMLRELWPRHSRVAIIRNPATSRYPAGGLEAEARQAGFSVMIVNCDGPARLLKAVAELKGRADFLLCFPDADLFNPMTIKPLVLAALEARLPIVGFSPAFVRAGAAVGVYSDYREIGRQTGEMVLRRLRGDERTSVESPRKTLIAVNQRILRILGVEFNTASLPVETLR